ncbi:MAG: hypothetical protein ACI8PT_002580 [Gammaproteobacteria bacterium]
MTPQNVSDTTKKALYLEARTQGFSLDNRWSLTAVSLAAFLLAEVADTSGEPA